MCNTKLALQCHSGPAPWHVQRWISQWIELGRNRSIILIVVHDTTSCLMIRRKGSISRHLKHISFLKAHLWSSADMAFMLQLSIVVSSKKLSVRLAFGSSTLAVFASTFEAGCCKVSLIGGQGTDGSITRGITSTDPTVSISSQPSNSA